MFGKTNKPRLHVADLVVAIAAGLWLGVAGAGQVMADPVKTGVQLYLDVKGAGLGDKVGAVTTPDPTREPTAATSTDASRKVDLGSVPMTLSAKDSDAGWGVVAGGDGQYVVPLSDSFSLISHGGFTKSQDVAGSLFGDTSAHAGPGVAFQQDDLALSLQPDLGVTMQSETLQQVDYGLKSTLSKDLFTGLTATTSTGYTWQDASAGPSRLASEKAGLAYTLPNKVQLGLGYQVEQKLTPDHQLLADKQGPSVSAAVPVTDNLNLGTSYTYTSNATDLGAADATDGNRSVEQTLGVSADWNLGADINSDIKVKAKLDLTRQAPDGTSSQQVEKSGSVGMQMNF
jgi:hypothetical protein